MKVRLLGTGAADGLPAIFCDCRLCESARELGGKDIRSRSSALVDGSLKIDLGPDTLCQIHQFRLNPTDWEYVLYTHSDDDHFAVRELQYLLPPFVNGRAAKFQIGANDTVLGRIATELKGSDVIRTFRLSSFQTSQLGKYKVTGIRAKHLDEEDALNLIVDDGDKKLLYATDTGWWADPTWRFMESLDAPLDLLVVDCSHGCKDIDYCGHLDIGGVIRMRERLVKAGALTAKSRIVSTHHGHNGGLTHAELSEALNPHGIEVGFDGLEISL